MKIICLVLVSLFVLSTIGLISSPAEAFPVSEPQSNEYIFYDDFETTLASWTLTNAPAISTDYATHGTKSVKFTAAATEQRMEKTFASIGGKNSNIVVECWFYDTASVTALADIYVSNATTSVKLGLRTVSTYYWSVWHNNVNTALSGGPQRSNGWHNLQLLVQPTKVIAHIDDMVVGNYNLTSATKFGFEKFSTSPILCWVDQFIVYKLFQDTLMTRYYTPMMTMTSWHDDTTIEPSVLYEDGVYKMWYRGHGSGGGGLGYATSTNGFTWTPYGSTWVCLAGGASCVKKIENTYIVIYGNPGGWYLRTSLNGIDWTSETWIIHNSSASGWKYAPGNVDFWYSSGTYYMMYEAIGENTDSVWKIGLATSTNLINWNEYAGNPVFGSDDTFSAGGPYVETVNGIHYMAYHRSICSPAKIGYANNLPTDIAIAKSYDLVNWEDASFSEYLVRNTYIPFEVAQVADPFPLTVGDTNFLYYCGSTDGWDGQIYVATSSYSFAEIATGNILQNGSQWIGNIGVTNNITAGYPRTYWYEGINAMKGNYFYDWNITTNTNIKVRIDVNTPDYCKWTVNPINDASTYTFTIGDLTENNYLIFKDGIIIGHGIAPTISFTENGDGVYEIKITNPYIRPFSNLMVFLIILGVAATVIITLLKKKDTGKIF